MSNDPAALQEAVLLLALELDGNTEAFHRTADQLVAAKPREIVDALTLLGATLLRDFAKLTRDDLTAEEARALTNEETKSVALQVLQMVAASIAQGGGA